MGKKTNRGKDGKAVTPQKEKTTAVRSYINCKHLAKFFGLSTTLILAIAETSDNAGGVHFSPVAVVVGTEEFISLTDGNMKTTARSLGFKQDFYAAIYCYNEDNDEFIFTSSVGAKVAISAATLVNNFGRSVITRG